MALFIVVVILSGYLMYRTYASLGEDIVRRTALLIGGSVNEILANAADKNLETLTKKEKRSLRRLMRSLTSEQGNIIHILLINDRMRILLSSDPKVEGREYTSPEELANLQGDEAKVITKTWDDSIRVIDVILPLKNMENAVYGYLRLVLSQKGFSDFYKDVFRLFLPLVLLFALLIGFTIYFIARAYSKPLESIEKMAENIAQGDYSFRINYGRKDQFTDTFSSIDKSLEKVNVLKEGYKKAEKRINALLQAVDESIILFDTHREIVSYNEAGVELFQCPVEMLFESHFKQIQTSNSELEQLITRAFNDDENIREHEMTLWLPDGSDVLARVSAYIFREGETLTGVLLTIKNQKSINELQRNLRRSMKFGVIANLASSISHEIKNPLSSMAIHTEILSMSLENITLENRETVDKSLNTLQNEVKRLNRIINQFFNLARVKKVNLNAIDINMVLEDVLFLVQQQAVERHIKIERQFDTSIDRVYGEPDQLKQVFLNIILNAFQAIHNEGQVTLYTTQISGGVHVEIEDNGCGMPHDVQDRIFDLYYTTKHDGGGIGMSICKNIIEAHEGKLWFKSQENIGTVFTIEFPPREATTQLKALKASF